LRPEDIERLFEVKDRSKSGPTAPAQGLVMVAVQHEETFKV
jgi:tRNA U38,U39,U40 pseudouridine synthase TruA